MDLLNGMLKGHEWLAKPHMKQPPIVARHQVCCRPSGLPRSIAGLLAQYPRFWSGARPTTPRS